VTANDFRGRVALVTGAAAGLGRQYVVDLATRGAHVMLNAIDRGPERRAELASFISHLRERGCDIDTCYADVAVEASALQIVDDTIDRFGTVDILVNNAGYGIGGTVMDVPTEDLAAMFNVHVFASMWTMRRALQHMRGRGYGRIVNTASGVGAFGMPVSLPYATAKAAVFGLSRSAALDNLDQNIRINAISPIAQTKMGLDYRSIHAALDENRMHVQRVSPLLLYLAHADCAVTGEAFHVAGGRVAQIFTAMNRGFASDDLSPDQIAAHLDEIHDKAEVFALNNTREQYDLIPK
jgi:NAD(P)-dependent dehydrogenase (short-subunit alcohol dehydrogenase family)